jgi:hypothetical protein
MYAHLSEYNSRTAEWILIKYDEVLITFDCTVQFL